jgi:branched-chain amino acid transport system substrate-binding protein
VRTSVKSHGAITSGRSSAHTNGWNPEATVSNAERAARNPQTIAYIGDLSSDATELSLPILNQAGILQITPGSGYPGLTTSYKGVTLSGEPDRYYPQSPRTLLRLIPNDTVQASAALSAVASSGCKHVAAWSFGKPSQPTTALLYAVKLTAPKYGMKFYKTAAPAPGPKQPEDLPSSYAGYIGALAPYALRCGVLVGNVTPAAVAFTAELRLLAPIPVVGTSGFCNRSWARIPDTVSRANARNIVAGLLCTTPALPVTTYQGHGRFLTAFRAAYHRAPDAYAYYGYEAAEMILRTLAQMDAGEDNRQQLVLGLVSGFATAVTGPFTFDGQGNVLTNGLGALAGYGIDDFHNGAPRFDRLVNPAAVLHPSAG